MVPGLLHCSHAAGSGRGSEARVENGAHLVPENAKSDATESGTQTPDDAQVKAVLDKMAAAGITRPNTVADVRKAYLFLPEAIGNSGALFSH